MPQFERKTQFLTINGIGLNTPIDMMPDGKWPILENVRSYQIGRLESRAGMIPVNASAVDQLNCHSIKRLNNPLPSASQAFTRLLGSGTKLYSGTSSYAEIDAGYSGNPLSLIDWRPDQSSEPWAYVYDSSRMRKVRVNGTDYQVGITAPNTAPSATLAPPYVSVIDNGENTYTNAGTAGAVSSIDRVPASTTISVIVYDSGSSGWATISPTNASSNYTFMGELVLIELGGSEYVQMVEVHQPLAATTVANVSYDSGSTGLCVIQPTGSWTGLGKNAMVTFSGTGSGSATVQSVTLAPDGSYSFRCSTSGTIPVGATVNFPPSFRAYTINTFAATNAIEGKSAAADFTGSGEGSISRVSNFDLSQIAGTPARATQADDYIHLSIKIDKLQNIVQGKLIFDVDAATNDFTQNYYFKAFRPNDFVPVTVNEMTVENARQIAIQRYITDLTQGQGPIQPYGGPTGESGRRLATGSQSPASRRTRGDYTGTPGLPDTTSEQTTTGQSQWTELIFRFSDLIRVGSDTSRTLANIKAWRFSLETKTPGPSDVTEVDISSMTFTGTFGPDQGLDEREILYRYRYRSSLTGARSTPSPATRSGLLPRRARPIITTIASADPQVDLIDVERFGGTLSDWHFVGTIPNGTGPFNDYIDDLTAAKNDALETDVYLPFPSIDIPRSATVNVIGTTVIRTGGTDTFNTSWAPGTPIKINGTIYTLYGQPTSTTRLEIVESGNSQASVPLVIDEPIIIGNNLSRCWGPFSGFVLGVGDTRQPGFVRFTKSDNPDGAPEHYYVELTSPSDPLQNGVLFDGRCMVASTSRWFDLRTTGNPESPISYQELTVDRGLFSPWAITTGGGRIWFLAKDGIYWTTGGQANSITFADLQPLFPHEDQPGIEVNGFYPPDMTQTTKLRLSWEASWLYFNYQDTNGNARTLSYNTVTESWWPDKYAPGVNLHYGDEVPGSSTLILLGRDGRVYTSGGRGDGASSATEIAGRARSASTAFGDQITRKLFGDLIIDANTQNLDVAVTAGFNDYSVTATPFSLQTATRQEIPFGLIDQNGLYRNLAVDFSWSSATTTPFLYAWSTTVVPDPETAIWQPIEGLTNYWSTTFGFHGWITIGWFYLAYQSSDSFTFRIDAENGKFCQWTFPSSGGVYRKFYFTEAALDSGEWPLKGRSFKFPVSGNDNVRFYINDCEMAVKPWGTTGGFEIKLPFEDPTRLILERA